MEEARTQERDSILTEGGYIQSIFPANTLFGFTYWSLMIPPTKPERVLILGYCGGTIGKLIKLVWGGDVRLTGVDKKYPEGFYIGELDECIEEDAETWVEQAAKSGRYFDYVVVDLYNGSDACNFQFYPSFISNLNKICGVRIALNLHSPYYGKEKEYRLAFQHQITKEHQGQKIIFFKKKEQSIFSGNGEIKPNIKETN